MSDSSAINSKFPMFGWATRVAFDLSAANGNALTYDGSAPVLEDLISSPVLRTAGLHRVGVYIFIPAGLWTGSATDLVSFVLEGSNDGLESTSGVVPRNVNDHWATIAELDINEYFDGTGAVLGQIRLLGQTVGLFTVTTPSGSPDIDVQRFKYLRVRAVIVSETAPPFLTFTMNVYVQGIGGDAEAFERPRSIVYAAGEVPGPVPYVPRVSAVWERPAGTRFMTGQVVASDILLDGTVTSVGTMLQGAFNSTGPFFNIAALSNPNTTPPQTLTTINQSLFFQINGRELMDMDPFKYFRFLSFVYGAYPVPGVPGAGTRYTLNFYPVFDGNDVIAPDTVSADSLERDLAEMFINAIAGGVTTQTAPGVGGKRNVSIQIEDIGGRPIRDTRPILVSISEGPGAQYFDGTIYPSAGVQFFAVTKGTFVSLVNTTAWLVVTDSDGIATLTLNQSVAGPTTVYVHCSNYVPQNANPSLDVSPGQVLIREEPVRIQFA